MQRVEGRGGNECQLSELSVLSERRLELKVLVERERVERKKDIILRIGGVNGNCGEIFGSLRKKK